MLHRDEQKKRHSRVKKSAQPPAIAAFCCIFVLVSLAGSATQSLLPPEVSVRLEATPEKAAVGDPITVRIDVKTPPGFRVEILKPQSPSGDFSVLNFSPESPVSEPEGGAIHHQARMTAAVYKTGAFEFPPVRIALEDGSGVRTEALSPSVKIDIRSVVGKDFKLKDLKKQADIPDKFRWLTWLALAFALCILTLIGRRLWNRKRNVRRLPDAATPARDPLDIAESDLEALLAGGLPAEGREKKFYILLSDVVKRILEAGFKISAAEQTTSEIMGSMRRVSGLSAEMLELVESFLVRCDLVKFARYRPSTSEHEAAGENARKILAAVRDIRRQSVAGPQHSAGGGLP